MNKRKILTMILAAAMLFSALSVHQAKQTNPQIAQAEVNERGNVYWAVPMGANIADYAVADEKVFAINFNGFLKCMDQQTGSSVWNNTLGGYLTFNYGNLIKVANGRVYVGVYVSALKCLNESTGAIIWTSQRSVSTSFASKSAPTFTLANGRILVVTDHMYMIDAVTGALLWDSLDNDSVGFAPVYFSGTQVFTVAYNSGVLEMRSVDAASGSVQWRTPVGIGVWPFSTVEGDGRIIALLSYPNATMLCFNESTGNLLWTHGLNSEAYEAMYLNGRIFFGQIQTQLFTKEYLYAIRATDGSTDWSSLIGSQNFTSIPGLRIEASKGIIYAGETTSESVTSQNVYAGSIYAFQENGNFLWQRQVSNLNSAGGGLASMTPAGDSIYVIASNDLYKIGATSGNIDWKYTFQYWALPPTAANGRLFVAADLEMIAFDPTEAPQNLAPTDLYYLSSSQPDTILISGSSQTFQVQVTVQNGGFYEAQNVRLQFLPNYGNITFLYSESKFVSSDQQAAITATLEAKNTGETHGADFAFNILYEVQGEDRSLTGPDISITIVPIPTPPFYATPIGIAIIVTFALLAGIAVAVVYQRVRSKRTAVSSSV